MFFFNWLKCRCWSNWNLHRHRRDDRQNRTRRENRHLQFCVEYATWAQFDGSNSGSLIKIEERLKKRRFHRLFFPFQKQYVFIYRSLLEFYLFGNTRIEASEFRSTYSALKKNKQHLLRAEFNVKLKKKKNVPFHQKRKSVFLSETFVVTCGEHIETRRSSSRQHR